MSSGLLAGDVVDFIGFAVYQMFFAGYIQNSTSWTPGAIANGAQVSTTVAVPGCQIADFAQASYSAAFNGVLSLSAYVSATGIVTVVLQNNSGSSITPTPGTVYARTDNR